MSQGRRVKGLFAHFAPARSQASGRRVGLYTSPHGNEFTERIQINRQEIDPGNLVELVQDIKPAVEAIPELTTFEISTALALVHFASEGVDAAVLEVGLGGRLDATNIITPVVSVITSISYDHTQFLGESLPEIAGEKAGIIKPGIPVVLAPQQDAARLTIERIAAKRAAPIVLVGQDYLFAPQAHSLSGQSLLIWSAAEQPLADAYIESGGADDNWEPIRLHIPLLRCPSGHKCGHCVYCSPGRTGSRPPDQRCCDPGGFLPRKVACPV